MSRFGPSLWLKRDRKGPHIRRYAGATVMVAWLVASHVAYPMPASSLNVPGSSVAGALVCFYRNIGDGGDEDKFSISVDGTELGTLTPGTFLFYYAPPGRQIAWIKGEISVSRTLVLIEGARLYVRVDRKKFLDGYRPGFTLVREERAAFQIRGAGYVGADPMADTSVCERFVDG